jgi:hypothetical protein
MSVKSSRDYSTLSWKDAQSKSSPYAVLKYQIVLPLHMTVPTAACHALYPAFLDILFHRGRDNRGEEEVEPEVVEPTSIHHAPHSTEVNTLYKRVSCRPQRATHRHEGT